MTTQQAIEALHALPRLGSGKPGLERMKNLLDHLGNRHDRGVDKVVPFVPFKISDT